MMLMEEKANEKVKQIKRRHYCVVTTQLHTGSSLHPRTFIFLKKMAARNTSLFSTSTKLLASLCSCSFKGSLIKLITNTDKLTANVSGLKCGLNSIECICKEILAASGVNVSFANIFMLIPSQKRDIKVMQC